MNLMFSRRLRQQSTGLTDSLVYLQIVNVVMHATRARPTSALRARLLPPPRAVAALRVDQSRYSTAEPFSPFEHNRYDAGEHGKILIFKKRENIIRAGKHQVVDGSRGILFFLKWIHDLDWPTAISAPNIVLLGQLARPIPEAIRDHYLVSWSPKFPGVAVNFPDTSCTPELYLSSNKFILPGVTGAAEAVAVLARLVALLDSLRETV